MPQSRHIVERVRTEKWDLHLDRGAKGSGFGCLLPSAQADPREAASYCPSPRVSRLPDQALVSWGFLGGKDKELEFDKLVCKKHPRSQKYLEISIDPLLSARGGSG